MNTLEVTFAEKARKTIKGVNIDTAIENIETEVATKATAYTVADIKAISSDVLSKLKCGDIVSKEDATGKHAYVVTFKKDNVGVCLTYADGSGYIETVSYDYVTDAWVYNSTDVFEGAQASDVPTDSDIDGRITTLVQGGTLENAKPIYCHPISLITNVSSGVGEETRLQLLIFNNEPTAYTASTIISYLKDLMDQGAIVMVNGYILDNGTYCGVYNLQKITTKYYLYYYIPTLGRNSIELDNIVAGSFIINDGINKIN